MILTDILPIAKWIELEKEIVKKTGLNAGIYDINGVRITSYKKWPNKLCPQINTNKKGQTFICAPAYQNMAAIAEKTRKGVAEECDAGLGRIVVPIIVDNKLIGTAGGCGLMFEDGEIEAFYINKNIALDEETIEEMAGEIKEMTDPEKKAAIDFIEKKVYQILENYGMK
jgi:ligand-binding sensor protein